MALTFPSSPINGAVSGEYTYDATKTAWRKNGAYPVSVTHSDVAPSNPRAGDQWWKSNEGTLFTYYNDGNSSQWVESTNVVASSDPNPIPAGAMMAWASSVVPANWLLCDGSAVSRSTYASLFAAIGTQYGSGDGVTTFNLPNLKGRTIVGRDSSQTEFDTLGETGGTKTHTLTESEMPSHTHTQNSHTHTFSGTTDGGGSHDHQINVSGTQLRYLNTNAAQSTGLGGLAGIAGGADNLRATAVGNHTHTYSGTTSSTTATNQNTGGGGAHNNLQPYIVLNYIIKFSAGETPGDSQLSLRVGAVEAANNATPLSPNYVINGAFDVWQRGTSFSTTGVYTADRWLHDFVAGAGSVTQQAFTPGAAPVSGYEGTYFLRKSVTTGAQFSSLIHRVEDVRTLSGQTATLSFWAKGTNPTGDFSVALLQNYGSGGSAQTQPAVQSLTLTSSWVRYSYTFTLGSMSGKTIGPNSFLWMSIYQTAANTSGSTLDIWGVQLEAGPYATPFRRNAPSIQAELAACQRYYWRQSESGMIGSATYGNATSIYGVIKHPVQMRTAPSSIEVSNLSIRHYTGGTSTVSSVGVEWSGTHSTAFYATAGSRTANDAVTVYVPSGGYLGFSAEL